MNKTIIVLEGADEQECDKFLHKLKNKECDFIVTNADTKMFKLIDGELFEVVTSLEKVVT